MELVVITVVMLKDDNDTEVLKEALELYVEREELNAVVDARVVIVPDAEES